MRGCALGLNTNTGRMQLVCDRLAWRILNQYKASLVTVSAQKIAGYELQVQQRCSGWYIVRAFVALGDLVNLTRSTVRIALRRACECVCVRLNVCVCRCM